VTPTQEMEARPDVVKVRRDGGKGWHWIWRRDYDPAKHELLDPPPAEPAAEAQEPMKRGPGRPRKHT